MNRKKWTGFFVGMAAWLLMASFAKADVKVTSIEVKPRYPWNGLVDIVYSISSDEKDINGQPFELRVEFEGYDAVLDKKIPMKTMTGDGAEGAPVYSGTHTAIWNAAKDYPTINSSAFQVKIHASVPLYMVVDLSGGPNAEKYPVRYTGEAPDLTDDTCRTTELWLRRIPAGKFLMGSPEDEPGRQSEEILHEVTITHTYYIGIFELTGAQHELIQSGSSITYGLKTYPASSLEYTSIRGDYSDANKIGWPQWGHNVTSGSLMGKLNKRTNLTFDLPTEAEWEYACRAGTTTALNSGDDVSVLYGSDDNMNKVGRYKYNTNDDKGGSYSTKVGSYMPNKWGIYDMHGNVWEWCLDRYGAYDVDSNIDPQGANTTGNIHILRGGSYCTDANKCRSAMRFSRDRYYGRNTSGGTVYGQDDRYGCRIVCHP